MIAEALLFGFGSGSLAFGLACLVNGVVRDRPDVAAWGGVLVGLGALQLWVAFA